MTAPAGPYRVVHHWTRWSIEDARDPDKKQPIHDTEQQAQADADRRNTTYTQQHTPRPPAQPDLFNQQEATG